MFSLESVRSQPQPSIIPDKPSSHNSRVSQSVGQRKAKLFVLDEDDNLPRLPSEDVSDNDPELAIAIQASLDAHSCDVPSTEKPLTAPLASVLPKVDDIEDLYESPSRLKTALAIHCSTLVCVPARAVCFHDRRRLDSVVRAQLRTVGCIQARDIQPGPARFAALCGSLACRS